MDYCLGQCASKILGRLKLKMSGANSTFLEAFNFELGNQLELSLPAKADVVPTRVLAIDEGATQRRALQANTGYTFKLDSDQHVVLDEESYPHYHKAFRNALRTYTATLEEILQCRKGKNHSKDHQEEFRKLLRKGNVLCNFLSDMCHRSTCFRLYLHSGPIQARLTEMYTTTKVCPIINRRQTYCILTQSTARNPVHSRRRHGTFE